MNTGAYQLSSLGAGVRFGLIAIVLIVQCGCLHTNLESYQPGAAISRLATTNQRQVAVFTGFANPSNRLGFQYLFLVIPFGTISLTQAERHLKQTALRQLALRGFRPITCPQNSPEICASIDGTIEGFLSIEIQNISLNAYDFIFFRRISCQIEVSTAWVATRADPDRMASSSERYWKNRYTNTETFKFAFEPQLRRFLATSLQQAVDDALAAVVPSQPWRISQ